MPDNPAMLDHEGADKKDDATLQKEADLHLGKSPQLQIVAELYGRLRQRALPWWAPAKLREVWGAQARMRWLAQRPDRRQAITTRLTGLAPKASRKKPPDFQAALIDSVIDDGDIAVEVFEEAFTPTEIAAYGPAVEIWREFRERMPWGEDTSVHQELVAWLIKALLADKGATGQPRRPILTPWAVRTAIEGRVWHTKIPLDIRIAIDEARFAQERTKPGEAFHASHELAIAVPEIICESVALKDLLGVIGAAERAMGFDGAASPRPVAAAAKAAGPPSVAPAPPPSRSGDAVPKAVEAPGASPPREAPVASGGPSGAPPGRAGAGAPPAARASAPPPVGPEARPASGGSASGGPAIGTSGAAASVQSPAARPSGAAPVSPTMASPSAAPAPAPSAAAVGPATLASPSVAPAPPAQAPAPVAAFAAPPAAAPGAAPAPSATPAPAPHVTSPSVPPVTSASPQRLSAPPSGLPRITDDETDDLEKTNPWAVPPMQDLGLDDDELEKLDGGAASTDAPQDGRRKKPGSPKSR